jgi:hypothetical protein
MKADVKELEIQAVMKFNQRNYPRAEQLFAQALEMLLPVYGPKHPSCQRLQQSIAACQRKMPAPWWSHDPISDLWSQDTGGNKIFLRSRDSRSDPMIRHQLFLRSQDDVFSIPKLSHIPPLYCTQYWSSYHQHTVTGAIRRQFVDRRASVKSKFYFSLFSYILKSFKCVFFRELNKSSPFFLFYLSNLF